MENGLRKLYWGFFFIMLSFRIQGFDIFPDFVGYVLFALGFSALSEKSEHFRVAAKFNTPMIVLSLFSIFQWPIRIQVNNTFMVLLFGILLAIALFAMNLYIIYNLFMGIYDIASEKANSDLAVEAEERWNQYKILQFAAIAALVIAFIPVINLIYIIGILIASLVILIKIMGFIKRCEENLI